jgi:predicted LPLAT superfamily acyltransferase
MGTPARFPLGPFQLAAAYKVPVSFVYALKEGPLHYHFFASEPRSYDFTDRERGLSDIGTDFALSMEKKVRQYPQQWYNYFNFWQS